MQRWKLVKNIQNSLLRQVMLVISYSNQTFKKIYLTLPYLYSKFNNYKSLPKCKLFWPWHGTMLVSWILQNFQKTHFNQYSRNLRVAVIRSIFRIKFSITKSWGTKLFPNEIIPYINTLYFMISWQRHFFLRKRFWQSL